MQRQLVEPPSSRTILEKSRVKASYLDFWTRVKDNQTLLPVYSPDIIEYLFDQASEIVARIRILLNRQNPSAHILRNEKLTTEKLWQRQLSEKPITDPEEFVRDLVHYSLQNAQGKYLLNLTAEKVDEYISIVQKYLHQARSSQDKTLVQEFRANAAEILKLVEKLDLENDCWKDFGMHINLKKIASETVNLKKKMEGLFDEKESFLSKSKKDTPEQEEQKQEETDKEDEKEEQKEEITEKEEEEKSPSLPIPSDTPSDTPAEGSTPMEDGDKKEIEEERKSEEPDSDRGTMEKENQKEDWQSSPGTPEEKTEEESEEGNRTPTSTRKKYLIKINEVAENVTGMREKIQHLAEVSERLDLAELAKNPREGSRAVNDLQKKCLEYTEFLMKDLLSLDEIIGSTTARTHKKQQINTIQELMADMDSVNERLKKLSATLKAEAAEAEQKEREENERKRKLLEEEQELKKKKLEQEKPTPPQQAPSKESKKEEEEEEEEEAEEDEEEVEEGTRGKKKEKRKEEGSGERLPEKLWRSLRLNANLEARELKDRFVIIGQLPGVLQKDLNVDLDPNQTLTISGARLPSPKEEAQMFALARAALARNPRLPRSQQDLQRMALEAASGRFGTFRQSYRLPPNVDKKKISASLQNDTLKISIPKTPLSPPRHSNPFSSNFNDLYW